MKKTNNINSKPVKGKASTRSKQYNKERIRLNKYIANAGICSRREADRFIEAGIVSVNGKIVKEMGIKVMKDDLIKFNDSIIKSERLKYLLLNKPKNYTNSKYNSQKKNSVLTIIESACKEQLYPIDYTSYNSTGLLLFTNDQDLIRKLNHPKSNIKRTYQAKLDRSLKGEDLEKIKKGLQIDNTYVKIDSISYIKNKEKTEVGIETSFIKESTLKKLFKSLNYKILSLDLVLLGCLTKKNLPRKKYRFLNNEEISIFKRI